MKSEQVLELNAEGRDLRFMTDIGFKRFINKHNPLTGRTERKFVKCKRCKAKSYYDYIPYSLSNPLMVPDCGHSFYDYYKEF